MTMCRAILAGVLAFVASTAMATATMQMERVERLLHGTETSGFRNADHAALTEQVMASMQASRAALEKAEGPFPESESAREQNLFQRFDSALFRVFGGRTERRSLADLEGRMNRLRVSLDAYQKRIVELDNRNGTTYETGFGPFRHERTIRLEAEIERNWARYQLLHEQLGETIGAITNYHARARCSYEARTRD